MADAFLVLGLFTVGVVLSLLIVFFVSPKAFPRKEFMRFYEAMEQPPSLDDRQGGITKSLERLIDKGLMIGYGRRTPKKWFIDEIRLTPAGTKTARRLLGEQQKLPFRTIRTK